MKATFVQNAALLDPQRYNLILMSGLATDKALKEAFGLYQPETFKRLLTLAGRLRLALRAVPFYDMINMLALYAIVLLFALHVAFRERLRRVYPPLLLLLGSLAFVVLGPALINTDRYGYPILYSMPLILALVSSEIKRKNITEAP